jgi:SNF2 family DNA or RNA helicase
LKKNNLKNLLKLYEQNEQKNKEKCDIIYHKNLRPYQNEDVHFLIKSNSRALFNQQRLGKTPTVLIATKTINAKKILIIAPKSTLLSWKQECIKWLEREDVIILNMPKKERLKAYNNYNVFICTYEMAALDYQNFFNFDLLILDEAHRLRNFKGQRSKKSPKFTKNIVYLSYSIKTKYILTGTPTANYSYEIFTILHILFPKLFNSYWNFINYYYIVEDEQYNANGDTKKTIVSFKPGKKQELQELLNIFSMQRKRKDYMPFLKIPSKEIIYIPMTKDQNNIYKTLQEEWEVTIDRKTLICKSSLDFMLRLRQIATSHFFMSDKTKSNKTEWILNFIKDYPNSQIIITSFFTSFLKYLHKLIPNSTLLIGNTSSKERYKIETDFNKKKIKILLGNIDVIKEGMKLEQGEYLIEIDPSLTYEFNNQLEDRIIPTSEEISINKNQEKIIKLISKDSIDEYILEMLKKKKSSTEIINDFLKTLK